MRVDGPLTADALRAVGPICWLIEWLHLDDRRAVVVADPERRLRLAVIDEDAADVGVARQLVLRRFPSLGVDADDAISVHAGGPEVAGLVEACVIRREEFPRHFPFREFFCPGVEDPDPLAAEFGEGDAPFAI